MSLFTKKNTNKIGPRVRGHFDQCDASCISGWVAGDGADERLQIEIVADGTPVSQIVADALREDLVAAGIGDGRHGFKATPPLNLYDGRKHTIEIREIGTGILLSGSPKNFQATAADRGVRGHIDRCDIAGVSGWVASKMPGERLGVEVICDGTPLSRVVADAYRADLLAAGIGDGRHGFVASLPQNLYDGRAHAMELREVATGFLLPGSPKTFQASSVEFDLVSEVGIFDDMRKGDDVAANGSPEKTPNALRDAGQAAIHLDRITGYSARGWSTPPLGMSSGLILGFGGRLLCMFAGSLDRPGVRATFGENNKAGFDAMVGGLLHFSALSANVNKLLFTPVGRAEIATEVSLPPYYPEGYTYAPLKALTRSRDFPAPGAMRGMRCLSDSRFSLLLEAGAEKIHGHSNIQLHFYQEDEPGNLQVVGKFGVELAGQLVNLEFQLLAIDRPVLVVVTDAGRNLLVTDCIPCPEIFLERYSSLIEYQSVIANGQPSLDAAIHISRNFLDFRLSETLQEATRTNGQPHRTNTQVLLFVRGDFDAFPSLDAEYFHHVADRVSFLARDGTIQDKAGAPLTVERWIAQSDAEFFLLCEVGSSIRPDFWAVVHSHREWLSEKAALVYWDSIWLEGASRPYWIKNHLLCHEAFSKQSLAPVNALIVNRTLLLEAAARKPETFCSGRLRPERDFHFAVPEAVAHLPAVMDICRLNILPDVQLELMEKQVVLPDIASLSDANDFTTPEDRSDLPALRPSVNSGDGVTIVINYRDAPENTIRCLRSIRFQRIDAPLEVILVNNGSAPLSVKTVVEAAIRMFGEENVTAIDYNQRFNYSAQCNVAVEAARYDFIFMLSNDSVLISKDAIARSKELAAVPWVGSCGFRVVAAHPGQPSLQSLGFKISDSKNLIYGRPPLVDSRPPVFCQNYTVAVAGNLFASVMLRKAVYREIGGMDEHAFPTYCGDVDFCLRATAASYLHVALGECLVGRSPDGSHDLGMDVSFSRKIIDHLPPLSVLTRGFNIIQL